MWLKYLNIVIYLGFLEISSHASKLGFQKELRKPRSLELNLEPFETLSSKLLTNIGENIKKQETPDSFEDNYFSNSQSIRDFSKEGRLDSSREESANLVPDTKTLNFEMRNEQTIVRNKNTSSNLPTPKPVLNSTQDKPVSPRILSSITPEDFLTRLKRHLEISKSNLKILKKNFHDFLKEKEKLFRLTQKVSQHYTPTFDSKSGQELGVVQLDRTKHEPSFVQDSQDAVGLPQLSVAQSATGSCPPECPVSMINIQHHHHGGSPIPCICEENALPLFDEESFISGGLYPMKSYRSSLNSNPVAFNSKRSNTFDSAALSPKRIFNPLDAEQQENLNMGLTFPNQNGGQILQHLNQNMDFTKNMKQEFDKKNNLLNNIQKYYAGCDRPTTHIPAACDIACIPCKKESTTCVVCPSTCPSKCVPRPHPCCSSSSTCKQAMPSRCSCGAFAEKSSAIDSVKDKMNDMQNENPVAFLSETRNEDGGDTSDRHSNEAKISMEDIKCTTLCPPTCFPSTCPPTCSTTCCTTPNTDGRVCPACPSCLNKGHE